MTEDDPENPEIISYELRPDNHEVLWPPPPPFTRDELYLGLRLRYSEEEATELADALAPDLDKPGQFFVGDILFLVALVSDDLRHRIQNYLNLDDQQMTTELERVRASGLSI